MVQASWAKGKNFHPIISYPYRMLKLGRKAAVARGYRPAIMLAKLGFWLTNIYHWLDRKKHSFFQLNTTTTLAIMHNIRCGMENSANAMPAIIPHYRIAVAFSIILDCKPNITQCCTWLYLLYATHHRFISDLS